MSDQEREPKREDIASSALEVVYDLGGAGLGLAIAGPPGALLGAAAPTLMKRAAIAIVGRYSERQKARSSYVIAQAAKWAGVNPDEVLPRMERDPLREELLVKTLRVAQDAATAEELVALARALANSQGETTDDKISWETAFVRALADCDLDHLKLLRAFTHSTNELGLGDPGPYNPDPSHDGLNSNQLMQLSQALGLGGLQDYLLATLDRHGLVRSETGVSLPSPPILTRTTTAWRITEFGHQFLDRMTAVNDLLNEQAAES